MTAAEQRLRTVRIIVVGGVLIAAALGVALGLTFRDVGGRLGPALCGIPLLAGVALVARGLIALGAAAPVPASEPRMSTPAERRLARRSLGIGVLLVLAATGAAVVLDQARSPALYGTYAGVAIGAALIAHGLWLVHPLPDTETSGLAYQHLPWLGYQAFVAWRYLLNYHQRVTLRTRAALVLLIALRLWLWLAFGAGMAFSWDDPHHVLGLAIVVIFVAVVFFGILRFSKIATVCFLAAVATAGTALLAKQVVQAEALFEYQMRVLPVVSIILISGGALLVLTMFFGTLRAFFTFFTTVPIGGVWIGTTALVVVLAVMSGFETDLREKILGSNAHIQVSREDGNFTNWREIKAKIDKIPGVVASTPFATSEVVITANGGGNNVIIKGIDPETVGHVTDLVSDLKDPAAIRHLQPLVDPTLDRIVPQPTRDPAAPVVDEPPPDMPAPGTPIDYSGDGTTPPPPPPPPAPVDAGVTYGGDAAEVLDLGDDPIASSPLIQWFTGDPDADDVDAEPPPTIRFVGDGPNLARTQALPGIIIGQELVRQQTTLRVGQEVTLVSPLSDPSNPDANGMPVPYNANYRVAGVFFTGMYEYDLKYVYVTLESLQNFLALGDTVDGIEVRVESVEATDRFMPVIRDVLGPGYRVQDWAQLNSSLFSALKLEKIAMFLILGIVILVASFAIIGNLIMVVVAKGRQIALLKTLGAGDAGVLTLFTVQGVFIGLLGSALGVITGLLLCNGISTFGVGLDPDVYYIDRLPVHVDPQSVVLAALTGVAISIVATLHPSILAARVRPATGMRH